ncbi:MAG: L-2-hydroxyglutarate oxidase [Nitrospira sp.]|nr:L-2-hydroxyglutarate oxidase [Nitrospira sp.]MBX3340264.1 L-2-hydroxyglutarate oxidase [Nitrospira sp.]MCW5795797.1 L-2-hydroxyglutarate oxidase [Nitrospira sp.]HNA47657.1 L-2-hydroxyglutarate oxidase [Nitrospira sp.]HNA84599.1 L-2-hydroxyglutarate oxidase [Nitrospira sp.]
MLADFLIIGGGVIGLNIARHLRRLYPGSSVHLLEKETDCGLHASGRNSGVLHAGFYYSPDSLKAKFTWQGNRLLTEYCELKGIPLNKCGKLVVAKDQGDLAGLDELARRGKLNGIPLESISEDEAKTIEPRVKTYQRALFSPATSTVDPTLVMEAMKKDALKEGVQIHCGVRYQESAQNRVVTTAGVFEAGYVVNAAGLYADRIAREFGFSEHYRILPFKGLYLYSSEPPKAIRTNIYPVPDLKNPFLGVHFTVAASGKIKIGPTAIPGLWREHYGGMANFRWDELAEVALRGMGLLVTSNFDFKTLAMREITKYSKATMVSLASQLAEGIKPEHYQTWGKPGIRAQLVDIKKRKLEMDFVLEGDKHSMHVLNAVSPAFTCSLPFSEYVCQQITATLN